MDGIIFSSVQASSDDMNIVLFNKASRCEELDIPEGTELNAHTSITYEDGSEYDFFVREEVPPAKVEAQPEDAMH